MTKNWQQSLKTALKGDHFATNTNPVAYSDPASQMFAPVLTESISKQINWSNQNDPLLIQFLPHESELDNKDDFHHDPVGDHPASPVPGLIHKYHGRVLLIASGSCAVNCRYCFRRHFPYGHSYAPRNQWYETINYIARHIDIHEVILSGGDPLTLSDKTLKSLTDQLESIKHVKTLRIHSRIPTVMPERIDASFEQWSNTLKLKKVMVLHTNHSNELSDDAVIAIQKLKSLGYTLLNQSVILRKVNDSAEVLIQLSHDLFSHGVLPYYLHRFDKVQNASHFDTPKDQVLSLYKQLQTKLPGYLLPKLVQEVAGEASKTMINLN